MLDFGRCFLVRRDIRNIDVYFLQLFVGRFLVNGQRMLMLGYGLIMVMLLRLVRKSGILSGDFVRVRFFDGNVSMRRFRARSGYWSLRARFWRCGTPGLRSGRSTPRRGSASRWGSTTLGWGFRWRSGRSCCRSRLRKARSGRFA